MDELRHREADRGGRVGEYADDTFIADLELLAHNASGNHTIPSRERALLKARRGSSNSGAAIYEATPDTV